MMRLAPRRAARVVAVSEATARDLEALYRVPRGKVAVVPEAADPRFRPVTDQAILADVRERYHLPERFVLAVGVRRPHKNLSVLLEAFALARDEVPHALVLAGEAHARYHDDVPETAARLGLADRLIELGHVPDADLPALYTLADLYALPSLEEGFGLPALEAMSSGTPVVASNTSSLPEVVGEAGLLADPRDPADFARAIVRAVGDRERPRAAPRARPRPRGGVLLGRDRSAASCRTLRGRGREGPTAARERRREAAGPPGPRGSCPTRS